MWQMNCTTGKCCYSVPLKIGCFIIAILYLLIYGLIGSFAIFQETKCFEETIQTIGTVIAAICVVASIIFIVGLCMDWWLPTNIFMIAQIIAIIGTIVIALAMLGVISLGGAEEETAAAERRRQLKEEGEGEKQDDNCPTAENFGWGNVGSLVFQLYCLFIVNSYRFREDIS